MSSASQYADQWDGEGDEPREPGEVRCPIDGCDYTGPVPSVMAHISGSTSDGHSGKLGANFRQELEEQHSESELGEGEAEEEAEPPTGGSKESAGDGPEKQESTSSDVAPTGVASQPAPSAGVVIGVLVLLVVIGLAVRRLDGADGGQPADELDEDELEDGAAGLIDEAG